MRIPPPVSPPRFAMNLFAGAALVCIGVPAAVAAVDTSSWTLVFSDDFSGDSVDASKWTRIDCPDWVSSDWRKYMDDTSEDLVEFTTVDGKSCIALKGTKNDSDADKAYREAGIYTLNKFSFQYGYVEICAKFDCVQGVWPALWLMPTTGTWPQNGEIDIMEHLNYDDEIYITLHSAAPGSKDDITTHTTVKIDKNGFNTYGMEWGEGYITFYVNGVAVNTFTSDSLTYWPYDYENNEFYLILSMQIGGSWVGSIDESALTDAYANLYIDYVNVWQIPEPGAFGPLAGTLALAFCAARRKRRHARKITA